MAGTYHVELYQNGGRNQGSQDGSASEPWKTLKYACERVAALPGTDSHTIRIGTGRFEDADRFLNWDEDDASKTNWPAVLPEKVSLIGNGKDNSVYVGTIYVPKVNNQTIASFEMDGKENLAPNSSGNLGQSRFKGLLIRYGWDLIVEDMRIEGFNNDALRFGAPGGLQRSELRYSELLNNGDPQKPNILSEGRGFAMRTGSLTDCRIHHNVFREERDKGGEVWNTGGANFTRVMVHDNTFWTHRGKEAGWTQQGSTIPQTVFNLEWVKTNCVDCEIYGNVFNGKVSLVQRNDDTKGQGDFGIRIHNNRWEFTNDYCIESSQHDLVIDHNYFHFDASSSDPDIGGGWTAIYNSHSPFDDIHIHHNVFDNLSSSAIHGFWGKRTRVENNTMLVATDAKTPASYQGKGGSLVQAWNPNGPLHDWIVQNNVIVGNSDRPAILINMNPSASVSDFRNPVVRNNFIDGGSSGFKPYFEVMAGVQSPMAGDPGFVASGDRPDPWFRPSADSRLVDAGEFIAGVTDQYVGKSPDIGAYEAPFSAAAVKLVAGNFSAYSDQDKTGNVTFPSSTSMKLTGNRWRKMPFNYTVTENTRLRFTVTAPATGEIIGVGFDDDDDHGNKKRLFQIGGSQNWSNEAHQFAYSSASSLSQTTYTIPVGDYYTTSGPDSGRKMSYLTFVGDADNNPTVNVTFSDVFVYEDVPENSGGILELTGGDFKSYSDQDGQNNQPTWISANGSGNAFTLTGNAWKSALFSYNITNATMLEVTVNAPNAGEIIGIAFDDDNVHGNSQQAVVLGGSQYFPNKDFDFGKCVPSGSEYTSGEGPVAYTIPIGSYLAQKQITRIGLIADDDANGATHVTFSNIRLYEP